jgi:membrane-associated protease RseP (regulator of RpoE activity)
LETRELLLENVRNQSWITSRISRISQAFGPQKYWLHISLFVLTFFTTTLEGISWRGQNPLELTNFALGLEYSCLLLLFLSSHEFGHFIAARIHGVQATLPFYIPMPGSVLGIAPSFGTFGAVIRTRSQVPSKKAIFDIGVAGPIAGFIVCAAILAIGFATLPGIAYIQSIHPGYPNVPEKGGVALSFGPSLLYGLFEKLFARQGAFVPPMSEMYHYPMLCVGWFGLFVTSLNLLPAGQLDGGHLVYGLVSPKLHRLIGMVTVAVLLLLSLPDTILAIADSGAFHAPLWLGKLAVPGGSTWLLWALVITFVIRFRHPSTLDESPLDRPRVLIGMMTLLIFVLSFTPSPIVLSGN